MTDDHFIRIENLCKTFSGSSTPSLKSITTSWKTGKIIGLVGPDGAGKTTLIRTVAGLLHPTEGKVSIFGYDSVKQSKQIQEIIGYMPQSFGLYEELSVLQNLTLYADLRGVAKEERKKTFSNLLTFAALAPFTDRLAKNLSGGMKQKLGLACALVSRPKLLILDEPTFGVDPVSRRELWKMVKELLQEEISVLWSTSYLDEAARCDQVLLLNRGELLFDKAPQELTSKLQGRVFAISNGSRKLLRQLLNDENIIDGVMQGDSIRVVVKDRGVLPSFLTKEEIVVAIEPRFEDAFLDILGGGPGGNSLLSEYLVGQKASDSEIIVADHLTKRFGAFTAVKNISFSVKSGEIFGLLGPNGAGKSTTFRMLCGLLNPTEGNAIVDGAKLAKSSGEVRAKIGYMAQKFSLYNQITTRQNLNFFSKVYQLRRSNLDEKIEWMVKTFELGSYLGTFAQELPMGFKQRLALACSIMHMPKVLFLDEPTSGVDPITRREFWNHINCLAENGVTIMLSTHFIDEAEYCDRIGLIHQGQLIALGTPQEIKEKGKNQDTASTTLEDAFIYLIENYKGAVHAS